MAELTESDRMRIIRRQTATAEAALAEGRYPESQRTALLRDAATFIRQEPSVSAGEDALFEASRSRMASDLHGAADILASATDPDLGFMPATIAVTPTPANAPRQDGRYDLGTAAAPAPASSSAVAATVEVDSGGHMTCSGLPVVIGADGAPRVCTSVGEVTVATLRSLGLDLDAERLLSASRRRMQAA